MFQGTSRVEIAEEDLLEAIALHFNLRLGEGGYVEVSNFEVVRHRHGKGTSYFVQVAPLQEGGEGE